MNSIKKIIIVDMESVDMKAIDIVQVKSNIKSGLLAVEIHNNFILLKDVKSGEAVVIGELPKEYCK